MTAAAQDVTAPRYARTLAERAALLEQFPELAGRGRGGFYTRSSEWLITHTGNHGDPWVLEWHRLSLTVDTAASLELARTLVATRAACRRDLRELVVGTAIDLGLDRRRFVHPAHLPRVALTADTPCSACPHAADEHDTDGRCLGTATNSSARCMCFGWAPRRP